MNVAPAVKASAKPTKLLEPRQRAFNHPAGLAQPTAMLVLVFAHHGLDPATPQFSPMPPRAVGRVALYAVGSAAGSPGSASDARYGVGQGQQLGDIVRVGCGDLAGQRNALGFRDKVVLAA